jgi:SAM-dependent methyltransferase
MTPDSSRTAASYDAVAEAYAETFAGELERKPFDREMLEGFAASLNGRVADVGCGPGQVAGFLSALGLDVLGLDISPEMVALARTLHPACAFEVGDMRALPLPDDALAGAVAFYALIHLERREVTKVLTEIRRVLRPGSPFLAAFHIGAGERRLETWFDKPVSLNFAFFGLEEMTGYAEAAGFAVEERRVRPPYAFEVQTERAYMKLRKLEG